MIAQPTPSSDNLLLGKGQVFFDRFDVNNLPTGLRHLGNVQTFELTTTNSKLQKFSSMSAGAPLYKEVNHNRVVSIKMVADEFAPFNLALALMGDLAALVQAATAVVAESVMAVVLPGGYFKLSKLGPYTAVSVLFNAVAGVLGVDYQVVNAKAGVYQILPGTILTGPVTASYTPTAYTSLNGPQIVGGGTSGVVTGKLVFVGDPMTGPSILLEVWKANIAPDTAIGLISDAYGTLGLAAEVLDDTANHPSHPLFQTTYLP